jgi:Spy/CpxP family protein refolding chaperone
MTSKLPLVLLGLSITFNVFFAGGFLQAQYASPKPEIAERSRLVAEQLGLSEEQKQTFARLREDVAARMRQTREATAEARRELWSQVSSGSTDSRKVRDLIEFEADQNRQLHLQMLDDWRQFLQTLTAEQHEKVLKIFQGRGIPAPGAQRPAEHPDATAGAKAGEPQRGTIRERFQSRWNDWQHSRQRWIERLDTDGDGKLSEQERAEAMKTLQEWRGNGQTPRQDAK